MTKFFDVFCKIKLTVKGVSRVGDLGTASAGDGNTHCQIDGLLETRPASNCFEMSFCV